ncbi:MAG: homoserine kinase [Vicinamibacteraceae bacterium]
MDTLSIERARGLRLRVPGSTSNLGPGFDALGLALQVYLELDVLDVTDDRTGTLRFTFEGGAPAGENAIATAIVDEAGRRGVSLPSLDLAVRCTIPIQAGLGSSAAAIVAGLRLVHALCDDGDAGRLLDAATALEGHPDNVSASILGGLTASSQGPGGVTSVASTWPARVRVVIATPRVGLATSKARGVLPSTLSRADAVFNIQRTALLLQALHTGNLDALTAALDDRLHQPYRAPLVPGLADALAFRHPTVLGAFLSGAGPSIGAFVLDDAGAAEQFFTSLYARLGLACAVRTLAVHQPDAVRARVAPPVLPSGVPA